MPDNPRDDLDRQLESWAASQPELEPSPEIQRRIQSTLASSLTPVKPLPAQRWLVGAFLAVFAACSAGLIAMMGQVGFHLMTGPQLAWMTAILAAGGILFSLTLAWQMVPGSRQRFPFSLVIALSGVGVIGGMALLFPWQSSRAFVPEGWPCAIMELAVAVPATGVFWLLARRGTLFASAGLGATLTGLAVFLALTPLQIQCMFQQAPHLLVWHGGMAAILIASGALIGAVRSGRWTS